MPIFIAKGLDMPTLSERLKELRKKKQLTQKELAEEIGVKQNSYSDWENGKSEPNVDTILKLSQTLNTSVDYLLGAVNFDSKNIPTKEEYNSFTDEQIIQFKSDMSKQAKLGNRLLTYVLARDNENVRQLLGLSLDEIDEAENEAKKEYVRSIIKEVHLPSENSLGTNSSKSSESKLNDL